MDDIELTLRKNTISIDLIKYLGTLSFGAIVLIASLHRPDSGPVIFLSVQYSVLAFFVSMFSSAMSCFILVDHVEKNVDELMETTAWLWFAAFLLGSFLGFFVGVALLMYHFLENIM